MPKGKPVIRNVEVAEIIEKINAKVEPEFKFNISFDLKGLCTLSCGTSGSSILLEKSTKREAMLWLRGFYLGLVSIAKTCNTPQIDTAPNQ
jgi:hypothetical protein